MAWQIDTVHSQIEFSIRHMMISKTRGRFESFGGTIEGDEQNPAAAKVDISIDVASINTRDQGRDTHLKSADFFDAATYPTITFKSTQITLLDANHATLVGNLTIRDVTRQVALDVEYSGRAKSPWGTTSVGFSASTTINRKDFGLTWNQVLETGGIAVGEEVKIEIELELVEQPESVPAVGATA